ncbi:MAG: P-loop NTPase fold protein [Candidatus Methanofastidiosia archaeon]|jgi:hypothetical protein
MLSDRETDIDALGFEPYVNSLSELITERGITPFTIGIFGSWGTGKTSLMLMLRNKLESQFNVRTVWFNAWKFDDEKKIWTALIQEILNQLEPYVKKDARTRLQQLRDNIEWIHLFTVLGTSILSGIPDINSLKSSFKYGEKIGTISEFERKFEKFVNSCDIEQLVIFIDDLDRCKRDVALDILEAIKLLLNSKGCVYILGLDYQRVCDAISKKFEESTHEVAEDYLDKIIQLSFHIPRRTETDMKLYLRYLFALKYLREDTIQKFALKMREIEKNIDKKFLNLLKEHTKTFSADEYKALTEHDLLIIRENEFNPRKLKRFLNIYEMRRSLSRGLELNLENEYLIKFLLLQAKFADFYHDLERSPVLLREMKKLVSLPEEKRKQKFSESKLLKEHYSNSDLLRFLREVPFGDVDPRPYLRIAQTTEPRIILGEIEKKVQEDLMSDDSVRVLQGLENFQELDKDQKETIVRDLLEKTEQPDPYIKKGSLQAFAPLREAIPEDLRTSVLEKSIEKTKDEDAEVREQAKWTLEGLREIIPEHMKKDVEKALG